MLVVNVSNVLIQNTVSPLEVMPKICIFKVMKNFLIISVFSLLIVGYVPTGTTNASDTEYVMDTEISGFQAIAVSEDLSPFRVNIFIDDLGIPVGYIENQLGDLGAIQKLFDKESPPNLALKGLSDNNNEYRLYKSWRRARDGVTHFPLG